MPRERQGYRFGDRSVSASARQSWKNPSEESSEGKISIPESGIEIAVAAGGLTSGFGPRGERRNARPIRQLRWHRRSLARNPDKSSSIRFKASALAAGQLVKHKMPHFPIAKTAGGEGGIAAPLQQNQ